MRQRVVHRSIVLGALACAALVVAALWSSVAAANNDPHRQPVVNTPFDIAPNVCGFTVHVDVPKSNEYQTTTTLADGTTVVKITGSLVWTLTNTSNGKSITLNASGPGTITLPPAPSTLGLIDARGVSVTYITNGAQFGLPNLFYYSGPFDFVTDFSNDTIVSVSRRPHVLMDVCAALA